MPGGLPSLPSAGTPLASIVVCMASSGIAGIGVGFFGCVLSAADNQKRENGGAHTKHSRRCMVCGVVGSTVFGLGSLVGLAYGPITVVTILRVGTTLPANVLFSQVFHLRPLGRDDVLGTVITISSVICFLGFVGPAGAEMTEDRFRQVLQEAGSIVYMSSALAVFLICGAFIGWLWWRGSLRQSRRVDTAVAVSLMNGCSSAYMDLSTKGWAAVVGRRGIEALGYWLFWGSLVVNVLFLVFLRVGMIVGCQKCDVLLFVPLNAVLNMVISVLAGFIALNETDGVTSWPGLIFSVISCMAGTVLLARTPVTTEDQDQSAPEDFRVRVLSEEAATPEDDEALDWRLATIVERHRDGTVDVLYDDHTEEVRVPSSRLQSHIIEPAGTPSSSGGEEEAVCCWFQTKSIAISRMNHRIRRQQANRRVLRAFLGVGGAPAPAALPVGDPTGNCQAGSGDSSDDSDPSSVSEEDGEDRSGRRARFFGKRCCLERLLTKRV